MPGLLDIILGYDCNLACDYCTITPPMRARALSRGQVLRALHAGQADDYDALSITGGEPTIRRDLLGLIRGAKAMGFDQIKLQSNGLLYAAPGNAKRIQDAGVTQFNISIHTHRADRYDALVRRQGTYASMVAGLDAVAALDVSLIVDLIMKRDTYEDLPDAVRWLCDRGVTQADLWFVSLTDANAEHPESMPRMTEVVPSMAEAFEIARSRGMRLRSLHVPRCLLGQDHGHAHDPGAARVRVVTPEASFELKHSRLTGQLLVPSCSGCEYESFCPGIRHDYLDRYGDGEFAAARGKSPTTFGTVGRSLPVVAD
ncbi:MAG: radical SAM protein [Myxococcota bacterium]